MVNIVGAEGNGLVKHNDQDAHIDRTLDSLVHARLGSGVNKDGVIALCSQSVDGSSLRLSVVLAVDDGQFTSAGIRFLSGNIFDDLFHLLSPVIAHVGVAQRNFVDITLGIDLVGIGSLGHHSRAHHCRHCRDADQRPDFLFHSFPPFT